MANNPPERQDISDIVLDITRRLYINPNLSEQSCYDIDIESDKNVKALYYYALRLSLEDVGYTFSDFDLEDCVQAQTIKDVVDAVWNDVNHQRAVNIRQLMRPQSPDV